MKLIKSDKRNTMDNELLNMLMFIKINFDFDQ